MDSKLPSSNRAVNGDASCPVNETKLIAPPRVAAPYSSALPPTIDFDVTSRKRFDRLEIESAIGKIQRHAILKKLESAPRETCAECPSREWRGVLPPRQSVAARKRPARNRERP
jgi:hypothetical protein